MGGAVKGGAAGGGAEVGGAIMGGAAVSSCLLQCSVVHDSEIHDALMECRDLLRLRLRLVAHCYWRRQTYTQTHKHTDKEGWHYRTRIVKHD